MLKHRRQRFHKPKIVPYSHPKFHWTITGLYSGRKRLRRFFETKGEAETFKQQFVVQQENLGTSATQIDRRLLVMAVEGEARLRPFGKTIDEAIAHYIRHLEAVSRSCTVNEMIEIVLNDKKRDGKGDRYMIDLRSRLGRFAHTFGEKLLAEISAVEIDDWLRSLAVAPLTRNNFRTILHTFFAHALTRRFCSENPVSQTAKAKVTSKPVEILTPEQTRKLLESASPEIVPVIAIGAFAGLRPAEISRLDWKEVRLERGFIEVTAQSAKTGSRRLVTILPNLRAWLQPHAKPSGPVEPLNARRLIDAARIRAGFDEWPSNALRHSFASFHLGKFQDAAALALQMGHATTSMIFAHYREVVTPEDADSYWRIAP